MAYAGSGLCAGLFSSRYVEIRDCFHRITQHIPCSFIQLHFTCIEFERHSELRMNPKYGDRVPYEMPRPPEPLDDTTSLSTVAALLLLLWLLLQVTVDDRSCCCCCCCGFSGDRSEYERPKLRSDGMRRIAMGMRAANVLLSSIASRRTVLLKLSLNTQFGGSS